MKTKKAATAAKASPKKAPTPAKKTAALEVAPKASRTGAAASLARAATPAAQAKTASAKAPASVAAAKGTGKAAASPAAKSTAPATGASASGAKAAAAPAPAGASVAKASASVAKADPSAVRAEPAATKAEPSVVEAAPTVAEAATPAIDADSEGARIARDPAAAQLVVQQFEQMLDARPNVATNGARVLAEVLLARPELLVPHTEKLAKSIASKQKRVVQTAADALPVLARIAPARVARYLDFLRGAFAAAMEEGQDGLVRTFSALCVASVAYQRRLEPVLTEALAGADGKILLKWTQVVLPALKGEPHARARAVVEGRLESLPRPLAQPIADFLGIKLRPPRPR